jgi:excisionase family DNA binding protein
MISSGQHYNENQERLLTVKEAASRYRVSTNTVYAWIYSGQLPALRINNAIRIKSAELSRIVTRTV